MQIPSAPPPLTNLVPKLRTHPFNSSSFPDTVPVVAFIEGADPFTPTEVNAAFLVGAADPTVTWADEADVAAVRQGPVFREKGCRTRPLHGDDYARSLEARALL